MADPRAERLAERGRELIAEHFSNGDDPLSALDGLSTGQVRAMAMAGVTITLTPLPPPADPDEAATLRRRLARAERDRDQWKAKAAQLRADLERVAPRRPAYRSPRGTKAAGT